MLRSRALFSCLLLALAVSGCMRTPGPVAAVPNSSLDALAYGGTQRPQQVAVPASYAYAPQDEPYRLDAGDRLRIVVYGQEGLTNTYTVGASGSITMPLIGAVRA